jgi:hypothetical protein
MKTIFLAMIAAIFVTVSAPASADHQPFVLEEREMGAFTMFAYDLTAFGKGKFCSGETYWVDGRSLALDYTVVGGYRVTIRTPYDLFEQGEIFTADFVFSNGVTISKWGDVTTDDPAFGVIAIGGDAAFLDAFAWALTVDITVNGQDTFGMGLEGTDVLVPELFACVVRHGF